MGDSAGGSGKLDARTTMQVWDAIQTFKLTMAIEFKKRMDQYAEDVARQNGITKGQVDSIVEKTTAHFESLGQQPHVCTTPFLQETSSMGNVPSLPDGSKPRKPTSRLPAACQKEINKLHKEGKSVEQIRDHIQEKWQMMVTTKKVFNHIARTSQTNVAKGSLKPKNVLKQSDLGQASTPSAAMDLPTQPQSVDAAHEAGAASKALLQPLEALPQAPPAPALPDART
jgi:hypothetical protein